MNAFRLAAVSLLLSLSTFATDLTWSGPAGGNWSDANNWSPNQVPTASDNLFFKNTDVNNSVIDTFPGQTINSLVIVAGYTGTISNTATSLTINGFINQGDGTINFTAGAASLLIGGNATFVSGTFSYKQMSLQGLVISGATVNQVSGGVACTSFNQSGGAFNITSGLVACNGNWSRTGGTFSQTAGTAAFDSSTALTIDHGGATFFNLSINGSGSHTLMNSNVLVNGTFNLTQSNGPVGSFNTNGVGLTVVGLSTIADGTFNCGTSICNFNGGLTLSGTGPTSGKLDLQSGTVNTSNFTLNGSSSSTGVGILALGTRSMNVTGAWSRPSFTNPAQITGTTGTVVLVGSGSQTVDSSGGPFLNLSKPAPGTVQLINGAASVSGTFDLAQGTLDTNGQIFTVTGAGTIGGTFLGKAASHAFNGGVTVTGTLNCGSGTVTTGNMTLSPGGTLALGTGQLVVNGNWSRPLGGSASNITGTTGLVRFNGAAMQTCDCSGGGFANLTKSGAGTLQLINANLNVTGAFIQTAGIFDTNGRAAMFGGDSTFNQAAGAAECTFDATSSTTSFLGTVGMNGGLLKAGTGEIFLFSGGFNPPDIFAVPSAGGVQPAIQAGLNFNNEVRKVVVDPGTTLTIDGLISKGSNGGVTKEGAGNLVLNANNTYTQATTVTLGTLTVNGSQPGSAISVAAGATLIGTGTTGPVSLAAGSFISPAGTNAGTLNVKGNLTFAATSSYKVSINGAAAGQFDVLKVTGAVDLTGATINISVGSFSANADTAIVIIDNDGSDAVKGTFAGANEGDTISVGGGGFKITYKGGDGNDVALIVQGSGGGGGPGGANLPPVVASGPTATPAAAGTGQSIAFSVSATDPENGLLVFVWNFGDGSNAGGASPTHSYEAAGKYTASVTVSDGTNSVSGSVMVDIKAPVIGSGKDSDGDGFSDAFELAAGSSISDSTSTPSGKPADANNIGTLQVDKLSIKLNFAKHTDSIILSGAVDVPAGFNPNVQKVTVDVGGVTNTFILSEKAADKDDDGSIKIGVKAKKGEVLAQRSKYQITLKGNFAATLAASSGLEDKDTKGEAKQILVTFIFAGEVRRINVNVKYTAKHGKSGSASGK